MSGLIAARLGDTRTEPGPTITELLTMAADLVAMADGQGESVDVGHGIVSVHVATQTAAEHLAWRLALDEVAEYQPTRTCDGFAVWSGGEWPEAEFMVFCRGDLVRPLRAFPRELHVVADATAVTGAA